MHARLQRLRERTNGYTVTPAQYVVVAYVALGALTLIVGAIPLLQKRLAPHLKTTSPERKGFWRRMPWN